MILGTLHSAMLASSYYVITIGLEQPVRWLELLVIVLAYCGVVLTLYSLMKFRTS